MAQNTSSAVMQQCVDRTDALNLFPTQPWATRAVCNYIEGRVGCLDQKRCWEPACGRGDMVRPLREYFKIVRATDVYDWGFGERWDFLFPGGEKPEVDWIITNPPFRLAEEFAMRALDYRVEGVALIVRTAFLEGVSRYRNLFSKRRPAVILQFTERVPMVKGRLTATGSTATAYCWILWLREYGGATIFDWIPPCRRALERPGDYDEGAGTP